jgi:tRNA threonylcarbamoyl adenosine modification protein (Sua5/YciO/YrdC/YwlC family)
VFGIAVLPTMPGATDRLFEAKRRPRDLTLPVLAASLPDAERVARFDHRAHDLASRFWPGALTIVLPRGEASAGWDLGEEKDSVGVRVPANDVALALLARTGPLATTSANLSGEHTPVECDDVVKVFGDAIEVYLCVGEAGGGEPSTVVDLSGKEPRIVRPGAVEPDVVLAALG